MLDDIDKGIGAVVEWNNKALGLEFETLSSDFERHKHSKKHCDLIVCWEDDDSPDGIDVLESCRPQTGKTLCISRRG